MRRDWLVALLAMLLAAGLTISGCSQDDSGRGDDDDDDIQPPDECDAIKTLDSIVVIEEHGSRLDWLHSEDLIAYDRMGDDGYYDVWIMNPDGTDKLCLTCDVEGLPQKNIGNPAWHPSGKWLVFQVEKENHPGGSELCEPGRGWNNDLWAMNLDSGELHQLTDIRLGLSTLHPQFSRDGSKLIWGETVAGLNDWVIKIADFDSDTGELGNIETLRPGEPEFPVWYETHGFSKDGQRIIFTANLMPGQSWTGADIYMFDLQTQELTQLTESFAIWDEHAHLSPDDSLVVWISSTGYSFDPDTLEGLKTDFWLMLPDGSCKTRLTYFNEEGHEGYTGKPMMCGDNAWNADGSKIAGRVFELGDQSSSKIVILNLK